MKQFKGYDKVQATIEREQLPKGAYICIIKNAEVKEYKGQNGDFEKFEVAIDIAEGEYKDFYANDYRMQQSEDKKWRGVLRQYLPKDDGSEKDEWAKSAFKALIIAIEESNEGFHWDWDESKLKGLKVGCLFRNEEWEFDGRNGWTVRPFKFIEAERVKNGKFRMPNDKPLNNKSVSDNKNSIDISMADEDLPF